MSLHPDEEIFHQTHESREVVRWREGLLVSAIDQVANEVPVAMVYNGVSHAVMLATPVRLESFGLGFSLTEGILRHRGELYDTEVVAVQSGIELQMTIAQERFVELKDRRRNLTGRTGCGLCGTESLAQVMRPIIPLQSDVRFTPESVHAALNRLPQMQSLQVITGAVHAAAWANMDGTLTHVEEDVGRHNALDKLIGTLAREDVDCSSGFVVVTSRASYEMVQKSASRGIPMLVAVSAPTALAIDLAERSGLTLVGFARGNGHVVYAHTQRLVEALQTSSCQPG